ncbi:MAG: hypothetical protein OXC82_13170 [Rhodobacteraceae bacterium]|nr:hypothetical protein [Paracoccaceae bacterium]MCY4251370.1 hypothetical protein [Paracoccaceae bacterium]
MPSWRPNRRDTEFAKLREDSAKRDRNMSIQVYTVAFGIVVVILGTWFFPQQSSACWSEASKRQQSGGVQIPRSDSIALHGLLRERHFLEFG